MAGIKQTVWVLLICGGLAAFARADGAKDSFKQANAAYADGQYSQAVSLYESARVPGLNAWVLDYNLGNAYYKAGQTGKAIASYLRAFRSRSNQRDIIYNLNLALTKVGDPLIPDEALAGLFWRAFYILPLNTLAILTSILFIVVCLGGASFFLGLWRPRSDPAFMGVLTLIVIGLWFGTRVYLAERHQGVVVSGTAEVRAAPNLSAPANFTVPEGRRVLILEEQEPIKGWLEIGVPQEGLKGWVPDSSVEPV